MRLSMDTLLLLGKLGDRSAEETAIWLDTHRSAAVESVNGGHIGAGWPGFGFFGHVIESVADEHLAYALSDRWVPHHGSHREWDMPGRWDREWDNRLEAYRAVWRAS